MRFSMTVVTMAAVAMMTGCSSLVSLNPVAAEQDAIIDSGLPGVWETGEKDGGMFVIRQHGMGYSIAYTEKSSNPARFEARLFQVGDAKLLDLVTAEDDAFQVPVHILVRVWPEGATMRWTFLDSDWLKDQVHGQLANQAAGERTLVTASSPQMRSFVGKFGADARAYGKPDTLTRVQQ